MNFGISSVAPRSHDTQHETYPRRKAGQHHIARLQLEWPGSVEPNTQLNSEHFFVALISTLFDDRTCAPATAHGIAAAKMCTRKIAKIAAGIRVCNPLL